MLQRQNQLIGFCTRNARFQHLRANIPVISHKSDNTEENHVAYLTGVLKACRGYNANRMRGCGYSNNKHTMGPHTLHQRSCFSYILPVFSSSRISWCKTSKPEMFQLRALVSHGGVVILPLHRCQSWAESSFVPKVKDQNPTCLCSVSCSCCWCSVCLSSWITFIVGDGLRSPGQTLWKRHVKLDLQNLH